MTGVQDAVVGRVAALSRYPLKSAGGEDLTAVDVTPAGLDGDRRFTLVGADGRPVTGKAAPGLRDVGAWLDGGDLVVEVAGTAVRGPRVAAALEPVAGATTLHDAHADGGGGHLDGAAVHVVSAGAASDPDAPTGCDPDPRANLVLDLAADTGGPGAERSWVGRRLAVGACELRVTRTPKKCLGVYAEVVAPGRVTVGDPVLLLG